MKKILAVTLSLLIMGIFVACATEKNAEKKIKATSSITMASAAGLMMKKTDNSRKSGIYKNLREEFGDKRVIAESFIRMEAYLANGKSEYEFYHKLMGQESLTERKLNEQDAFHATSLGLFLFRESTTIPGISVLQTYPNPQQFPDEAGFVANEHLEHIYNGIFQSKVGDTVYIPDLPLINTRVVNTAQQTAIATNDTERKPGDGFIELLPALRLKGRENNQLKIIVPAAANHLITSNFGTSGYKIKVALVLFGYKITGAGNVNS